MKTHSLNAVCIAIALALAAGLVAAQWPLPPQVCSADVSIVHRSVGDVVVRNATAPTTAKTCTCAPLFNGTITASLPTVPYETSLEGPTCLCTFTLPFATAQFGFQACATY